MVILISSDLSENLESDPGSLVNHIVRFSVYLKMVALNKHFYMVTLNDHFYMDGHGERNANFS